MGVLFRAKLEKAYEAMSDELKILIEAEDDLKNNLGFRDSSDPSTQIVSEDLLFDANNSNFDNDESVSVYEDISSPDSAFYSSDSPRKFNADGKNSLMESEDPFLKRPSTPSRKSRKSAFSKSPIGGRPPPKSAMKPRSSSTVLKPSKISADINNLYDPNDSKPKRKSFITTTTNEDGSRIEKSGDTIASFKLSSSDLEYLTKLEKEKSQKVLFATRARIIGVKDSKNRMIVLTPYRLFIIRKDAVKGRVIRYNYSVVDLAEISISASQKENQELETRVVGIAFNRDSKKEELSIQFAESDWNEALQHLLHSSALITHSCQEDQKPILRLSKNTPFHFRDPDIGPNKKDAVLFSYFAICDYLGISPSETHEKYLESIALEQTPCLDLNTCVDDGSKRSRQEFYSIVWVLKDLYFINEVTSKNISVGDVGIEPLSMFFTKHSSVRSLVLIRGDISSKGCFTLSRYFDNLSRELKVSGEQCNLEILNLSRNKIGDEGIGYLSQALNQPIALHTLILHDIGLTSKGVVHLVNLISQKRYLLSLKVLDLSRNDIGKAGSTFLEKFLKSSSALEEFNCANGHVHVQTILRAVSQNDTLINGKLRQLNLSGNKIANTSSAMLSNLLSSTGSLSHIILRNTKLIKSTLQNILEGVFSNSKDVEFIIDIGFNSFESALGKTILRAVKSIKKSSAVYNVKALIADNCSLGVDGLTSVCAALGLIPSLQAVILDRNITSGIFVNSQSVGTALASMVQQLFHLRILSIRGAPNQHLGQSLLPLFAALKSHTQILSLDISRNLLPLECYNALADALQVNNSLQYVNVDENTHDIKCIKVFSDMVFESPFLCGSIPKLDMDYIKKHKKDPEVSSLKSKLVSKFTDNLNNLSNQECESLSSPTVSPIAFLSYVYKIDEVNDSADSVDEQSTYGEEIPHTSFGVRLSEMDMIEVDGYPSAIPSVLAQLGLYLSGNGARDTVGIFRIAPDVNKIAPIKEQLQQGTFESVDDIHCISHLIKVWLRECPDKILSDLDPKEISQFCKQDAIGLEWLEKLQEPKRSIMLWLLDLCVSIALNESVNKMSPKNLAIVLAPNLYSFDNLDPMAGLRLSEELSMLVSSAIQTREPSLLSQDSSS